MTLGELKALVANFEAADDDIEIVTVDMETGRLANVWMSSPEIVGIDEKKKQTSVENGNKVLRVFITID